jgi:diaminopimelate epimerase
VNFIEEQDDGIFVRTYERGVEDETYSCGTGVTAAALTVAKQMGYNRINITTLGGKLAVEYTKAGEQAFHSIWLCGPATYVYEGQIDI